MNVFFFVQIDKLYNCVYTLSYQFILIKRTSKKALSDFRFYLCYTFLLYNRFDLLKGVYRRAHSLDTVGIPTGEGMNY